MILFLQQPDFTLRFDLWIFSKKNDEKNYRDKPDEEKSPLEACKEL